MNKCYGDDFQQQSKFHRGALPQEYLDWGSQPAMYKSYPQVKKIGLPAPSFVQTPALFDIIKLRKSIRSYLDKSLSMEQLSNLLWASTGIQRSEHGFAFRTVPSAGALYPIETHLVINRVDEVAQGIYHYGIQQHQVEQLKTGDFRRAIAQAALDQSMCASAGVVFIWTAVFARSKWKYGQRAYRYIYLDAGHIAQSLALAATGQGLGSCQIAALYDDEINMLIDVDGNHESVVYISSVGYPA